VTALHIFDMDGTLLRGTTAATEISRRVGGLEALADLERGFAAQEITAAEFAVATHTLWGEVTGELVAEVVAAAPWIEGIEEVCRDIAARGEHSMLITMSPDFFAGHLLERGIEVVRASAWPPVPFAAPIDPAGILNPADKVRLAADELAARGLPRSACVAYGDSMSDGPLFAFLENTVAVNADVALERSARVAYRGGDLREAYARGRVLLDAARGRGSSAPGGATAPVRGPFVGVSAVVVRDGRVLFGRRLGSLGRGTWGFPGGKVDAGEDPARAVRRELLEETGLAARALEAIGWTSDVIPSSGEHFITLHHLVSATGDPAVLERDKVESWRWFAWDALPDPVFAPAASLIATGWRPA